MSGGRCWSSIVATPTERAALRLGPDDEWLVGCVLPEGHRGAHASDGAQDHRGRRRWLVWGDFARGAQTLRDEEPCPVRELDGSACLFYLGHSGGHRYPSAVGVEVPDVDPGTSRLDRRPSGVTGERSDDAPWNRSGVEAPAVERDPVFETTEPLPRVTAQRPWDAAPSPVPAEQFSSGAFPAAQFPVAGGGRPAPRPVAASPLVPAPPMAQPPRPPVSDASAWPVPETPAPVWPVPATPAPNAPDLVGGGVPLPTPPVSPVGTPTVPSPAGEPVGEPLSAMDRLFAELPSLKPDDATTGSAVPTFDDLTAPWPSLTDVSPADPDPADPAPDPADPRAEESPHPLYTASPAAAAYAAEPHPRPVADDTLHGFIARHAPADPVEEVGPTTSGPARFEPVDPARSAKKNKHKRKKVDNSYVPSLGEDAPGGATRVVFRDDPDAALMEVRQASSEALTTSILEVIASSGDPMRIGVPTTLRPLVAASRDLHGHGDLYRQDGPEGLDEQVTGADLKAITDAVRDAADRLRARPESDDNRALGEALRDVAQALSGIANRFEN